jgi:tetratricopeptide (TPR) repeat protein
MGDKIGDASDMIRRSQPRRAISLLESLDDRTLSHDDLGMKHLFLGIAYHKIRNIDKSNEHYYKAMKYEHPTGYAFEHLAINLTKQGKLEEAIAVCHSFVEHPRLPQGGAYLTKAAMRKRMEKLEKRLEKKRAKK